MIQAIFSTAIRLVINTMLIKMDNEFNVLDMATLPPHFWVNAVHTAEIGANAIITSTSRTSSGSGSRK